jgi:hypothetical protein
MSQVTQVGDFYFQLNLTGAISDQPTQLETRSQVNFIFLFFKTP